MIITLGSVGGAPGVTSWSLLLAAAWPLGDTQRVMLEADPDGGVVGARYGLGVDPGAISLAASLRRSDISSIDVRDHGRTLTDTLVVVPGPETAERSSAMWTEAAAPVAAALATDNDRAWFVDVGRLRPGSTAGAFVPHSSLVLVLVRGNTEDLVQLPPAVARLSQATAGSVGVVVVGKSRHGEDEIADCVGTHLVWTVPASRHLPGETGGVLTTRVGRLTWLWRSALMAATDIAAHTKVYEPGGVGPS